LGVVVAIAVLACSRSEKETAAANETTSPDSVVSAAARQIVGAWRSGNGIRGCTDRSSALTGPLVAVVISGEACLGCRNVGHLLRSLLRDDSVPARPLLLVPSADSSIVCDFLKNERLKVRVVTLPQKLFPDGGRAHSIAVVQTDSAGLPLTTTVGPNGIAVLEDLMAMWNGRRRAVGNSRATQSTRR